MKIDRILIAQPGVASANPHYANLIHKYNVKIDFKPFFSMVPLSVREFRAQKVNIPDYTAIVFTSKGTIDAFFKLCLEQRIKIPDSQKYFCTSENISYYLQKHIIYRKRKIFYGDGTFASVVRLAKADKHKDDKFLLASPDHIYPEWISMFQETKLKFASAVVAKFVDNDLKDLNLNDYQLIAFYNALDITSLKNNFPNYKPGDTKFVAFGSGIRKAMDEAGLKYAIGGPTTEFQSLASALEKLIVEPDFKQTIMPVEKKPAAQPTAQKPAPKAAEKPAPAKPATPKPAAPKPEVKKEAPKPAVAKPAEKPAVKKTAPTPKPAAKPAAKKNVPAKKAAVKPAVKKQVAKPAAKKNVPSKKVVAKPAVKKSAPAKKSASKTAVKKSSPAKKVAAKKSAAKPVAKKSVPAKKVASKPAAKPAAKKAVPAKKNASKPAAKKAIAKAVPAKKVASKPAAKPAAKKAVAAKKNAPKPAAKKAVAKAVAKKPVAKKTVVKKTVKKQVAKAASKTKKPVAKKAGKR